MRLLSLFALVAALLLSGLFPTITISVRLGHVSDTEVRATGIAAPAIAARAPTARTPKTPLPATWRVFASNHPAPLFYEASGVAVGGRGNIFIADRGDHRVLKLDPSGKPLALWGTDTPGSLHFSGPWGIALGPGGGVYLADDGIVKLSPSGILQRRWKGGSLHGAGGVAVARDGTVYALALHPVPYTPLHDRMTVTKLSAAGKVQAVWVFRYPQPAGDAVLSASIVVAPSGNPLLSVAGQRFCHSCNGNYYQVWTLSPINGSVLSKWNAPVGGSGFAVDASGDVYLAGTGQVLKFTADGKPLATWGTAGCGPLQFSDELRLTTGPTGNVYIADSQVPATRPDHISVPFRDGIVHILSATGASHGFYGACPANLSTLFGQLNGVAAGPGRTVYAADEVLGQVDRVSAPGTVVRLYAANHPSWVASDAAGNSYVSDLQRDALEKRAPDGTLLGTITGVDLEDIAIGRRGFIYGLSYDGSIQVLRPFRPGGGAQPASVIWKWWLRGYRPDQGGLNPSGITLDNHGNVYVADTRFNHVQKFSATGRLLAIWGKHGSAPGQLGRPSGIVSDGLGHIYVLETGNNRVQEFGTGGRLLRVLGRGGQAPGQFLSPAGIAVDRRANLYVGDRLNDRIQELVISPSRRPTRASPPSIGLRSSPQRTP